MVDTGDVRAVGLGELNRERTDTAAGAIDQHPAARRHSVLWKVVERDQAGGGHCCRLFEADPGRFEGNSLLGRGGVLRERTAVAPLDAADGLREHLVAGPEPGDGGPHGLHHAGDVGAGHPVRGLPHAGAHQPQHRWLTRHDMPHVGVHRRCPDPDQHLISGGHRPRDLTEPEVVDTAIAVLDDRSHARTVPPAAGDTSLSRDPTGRPETKKTNLRKLGTRGNVSVSKVAPEQTALHGTPSAARLEHANRPLCWQGLPPRSLQGVVRSGRPGPAARMRCGERATEHASGLRC